ncbi:unnamed protein product [Phaeothamnion confervicola]
MAVAGTAPPGVPASATALLAVVAVAAVFVAVVAAALSGRAGGGSGRSLRRRQEEDGDVLPIKTAAASAGRLAACTAAVAKDRRDDGNINRVVDLGAAALRARHRVLAA